MTAMNPQHEWADHGPEMIADAERNAPMTDQALAWLADRVPGAAQVLDVGSGPGVAACTLAQLLPKAQVLAADGASPLLALARERADRLGVGDRFATRELALPQGLAELPSADLIWVSGVVHHLPDPAAAVQALAAALNPGGVLALREGGLPLRFLPSHADRGLSARMDAANAELSAHGHHPMGVIEADRSWPELLREAGLTDVTSKSFLLDVPVLDDADRASLRHQLQMSRDMTAARLSADDLATLDRLLAATGPESVLHRPDVFLLRAATIHTGTRG
jgi:SAM-dependent methyltransferase